MISLAVFAALATFEIQDNGTGQLALSENGKPVLVYNYGMVAAPEGVPAELSRSGYIHPLYDVDGNIVTQDFPEDHYHHRGVFWTWPLTTVGERRLDVWAVKDGLHVFEDWVAKEAGGESATVSMRNGWRFKGEEVTQVREDVTFVVHPSDEAGRALDFTLTFTNVTEEDVQFLGAPNKGYGGFCFRPDASRKPLVFTTKDGVLPEDALRYDTPWADVSWAYSPGGAWAGAAVFEHPTNPGYPFPGWIMRHYGLLGASWPHEESHHLKPGESFTLKYRLYIHRGDAVAGQVAERWAAYAANPPE